MKWADARLAGGRREQAGVSVLSAHPSETSLGEGLREFYICFMRSQTSARIEQGVSEQCEKCKIRLDQHSSSAASRHFAITGFTQHNQAWRRRLLQ